MRCCSDQHSPAQQDHVLIKGHQASNELQKIYSLKDPRMDTIMGSAWHLDNLMDMISQLMCFQQDLCKPCKYDVLGAHRGFHNSLWNSIVLIEDRNHIHAQQVFYCGYQILLEGGVCRNNGMSRAIIIACMYERYTIHQSICICCLWGSWGESTDNHLAKQITVSTMRSRRLTIELTHTMQHIMCVPVFTEQYNSYFSDRLCHAACR